MKHAATARRRIGHGFRRGGRFGECNVFLERVDRQLRGDDKRERCKALAAKLGGNPDAMFFGAG